MRCALKGMVALIVKEGEFRYRDGEDGLSGD
jgi:hypothetical protein